jgi:ornithine cyclodeaminase
MLLLSREDILRVFTMRDAIEADKTAFRIHSEGKDKVSLRTNLEGPGGKGQYLFMPAYAGEIDRAGIKIVSVFPGNAAKGKPLVPATVVLLDNETGEVCALLDGTTLTQIRTAAIAGAATDLLARPNSRVAALFGTGGQAPAQMEALLGARPTGGPGLRQRSRPPGGLRVGPARAGGTVRGRAAAGRLAPGSPGGRRRDHHRHHLHPAGLRGGLGGGGRPCHGIGSYTPTMQELPPELLERAARIYVDDREAVESEAGDFLIPQAEGRFSRDRITGELGELILGRTPGRTDAREITVMKTVGFATLDVVTADEILRRALAAGVGRTVAL